MGKVKRVTIGCGVKGTLEIVKRSRAQKEQQKNSLTAARMARLALAKERKENAALGSPQSICSNTTRETVDTDTSDLLSIGSPVNNKNLTGSSYESFVHDRKDFRHWGTRTFREFQDSGAQDDLLGVLRQFSNSRNKEKAHEYIVSIDELQLAIY